MSKVICNKLFLLFLSFFTLCSTTHVEAAEDEKERTPWEVLIDYLSNRPDLIKQTEALLQGNANLEKKNNELSQHNIDLKNEKESLTQELTSAHEKIKRLEVTIPPSASVCEQLGTLWNNKLDPFPLVEWINVSNLKSFYEPTFQSLLNQPLFFNEIDSLGQYQLSIQPYGFHSGYELDGDEFKLTTFGATVSGSITLKEKWILGAGVGYGYSSFNWGDLARDGSLNAIYVGPYLAYVFDKGYIDVEVLGLYNIYAVNQSITKYRTIHNNSTKWDLYGALEGALDFKGPRFTGANFFIQPNVNVSYLASLSHDLKLEEEEDETTLTSGFSDFLRGKIAVEFRKEFHQAGKGFIIPALSIGWVVMQPLSHTNSTLTCGEEQNQALFQKKYPSSQQLYVGAKFTTLSKSGFLFSLGADAYIAKLYPIYSGNIRFEWSW